MPWIRQLPINRIHLGALQPWMAKRRAERKSTGTHGLKIVGRILNLAASSGWMRMASTWLLAAPKIKLLPDQEKRALYP